MQRPGSNNNSSPATLLLEVGHAPATPNLLVHRGTVRSWATNVREVWDGSGGARVTQAMADDARSCLTRLLTPLPRIAASLRCLTSLPHSGCLTSLPHSAASHRCLTPLPHSAASHRCLTPLPRLLELCREHTIARASSGRCQALPRLRGNGAFLVQVEETKQHHRIE